MQHTSQAQFWTIIKMANNVLKMAASTRPGCLQDPKPVILTLKPRIKAETKKCRAAGSLDVEYISLPNDRMAIY